MGRCIHLTKKGHYYPISSQIKSMEKYFGEIGCQKGHGFGFIKTNSFLPFFFRDQPVLSHVKSSRLVIKMQCVIMFQSECYLIRSQLIKFPACHRDHVRVFTNWRQSYSLQSVDKLECTLLVLEVFINCMQSAVMFQLECSLSQIEQFVNLCAPIQFSSIYFTQTDNMTVHEVHDSKFHV